MLVKLIAQVKATHIILFLVLGCEYISFTNQPSAVLFQEFGKARGYSAVYLIQFI